MNREIKFRCWHGASSRMLAHNEIDLEQRLKCPWAYQDDDESTLMQYTGLKDKNGNDIYEGDILQFSRIKASGFHCAGGIYEGNEIESFTGVVEFDEGAFRITKTNAYPFDSILGCWGKTFSKEHGRLLHELQVHEDRIGGYNNAVYGNPEVIGNIYENPDLLK